MIPPEAWNLKGLTEGQKDNRAFIYQCESWVKRRQLQAQCQDVPGMLFHGHNPDASRFSSFLLVSKTSFPASHEFLEVTHSLQVNFFSLGFSQSCNQLMSTSHNASSGLPRAWSFLSFLYPQGIKFHSFFRPLEEYLLGHSMSTVMWYYQSSRKMNTLFFREIAWT